jgi:hypothetical protein
MFPYAEQTYIDSIPYLKKWDYKPEAKAPPTEEAV